MRNNKKLYDAIGQVDEKYVEEYMNAQKVRRPALWRTVIAASLAVAILAGAAIAVPSMLRGNTELGNEDTSPEIGDYIQNTGLGLYETEYITAADGSKVLHIKNSDSLPSELKTAEYMVESATELIGVGYNWDEIIDDAVKSTSADELIFKGITVAKDTYVFDKQITVYDSNKIVEYDVASGTTAIKEIPGIETGAPEVKIKRTYFTVESVRITSVLKENNNTGYDVGDIVCIYRESSFFIDKDSTAPQTYAAEETVTAIDPAERQTKIAVEPAAETTTAAPPYTPSTQYPADTIEENAIITAAEQTYTGALPATEQTYTGAISEPYIPDRDERVDINGDDVYDEKDVDPNSTTASSETVEMLYIVKKVTGSISSDVRDTGIIDFDVWQIKNSCTAEQYDSDNMPNDISDMQFYFD